MKNSTTRIALAEALQLPRESMANLLKSYSQFNLVLETNYDAGFMPKLKTARPEVLLMQLELPLSDKLGLVNSIHHRFPKTKLLVIANCYDSCCMAELINNGVSGFVTKNTGVSGLLEGINKVVTEGYYFDSKVSLLIAKGNPTANSTVKAANHPLNIFTSRELQVLHYICMNKSNKEIANLLHLSVRTVEGHRLHIMQKANVTTVVELTDFVRNHNLPIAAIRQYI